MRTIMVSRWVLGWLGLLAVVGVAGCTATSASSPAAPGPGRSAGPAVTTAVSPGAAADSAAGVRNLAVSRDVRSELTAAYTGYRGISLSDVAGTRPGSVYYAYDPATDTYWAEANFLPSRTASSKVLVGFQDGASIGLFTRAARSGWQVQLGGEPVACTEAQFYPQAVLTAWSLPTDTAAFGCSSQPARWVSSETFAVTISIPAGWQPTPDLGPDRFGYDGPSGWMQLNAMVEPSGLHYACTVAATGNVLHPYGLHPQIIYRNIDGRPGCLIFPSSDAARQSHRTGYPAFQDSEALVEYRQPVSAGGGCVSPTGQSCLYPLLMIDADPAHLVATADSVQLHHLPAVAALAWVRTPLHTPVIKGHHHEHGNGLRPQASACRDTHPRAGHGLAARPDRHPAGLRLLGLGAGDARGRGSEHRAGLSRLPGDEALDPGLHDSGRSAHRSR